MILWTKDQIPTAKYFWSITMYNKQNDIAGNYSV
ncbi:hypothetical protein [Zhouia amylolytica]